MDLPVYAWKETTHRSVPYVAERRSAPWTRSTAATPRCMSSQSSACPRVTHSWPSTTSSWGWKLMRPPSSLDPRARYATSSPVRTNNLRSEMLRFGKLALALRLARGYWQDAPRQHLAIWVLRGGKGFQRLRVADLDGERLELDDLASDVAGALQRTEQRSYRYARSVELSQILASGPVVPRGTRAVRFGISALSTCLDRVQTASLTTSENIPGYDITVAAGPGQVVLRHRSLSELVSAGQLTMRRGNRIDLATAVPGGTVRVLSADGGTERRASRPV